MATVAQSPASSPALFFETVNAYQRSAALKAAIELGVFSAIAEGAQAAREVAERCQTPERGMRILCDYLTIAGFLIKDDGRYELTRDSATFLDRSSPAYMGSAIEFLLSPVLTDNYRDVAALVRKGGTVADHGTLSPEHPVWVTFARAMAPMMALPAELLAGLVGCEPRPLKVLDIAAGHGLFGVAIAKRNPQATIVALDWPNVLEVALENARAAGVADQYRTLVGDAMQVDYGDGYDVVLLTNFLHHFDPQGCERLLKKVRASLHRGGRALALEFVPNDDRVSPPLAAAFSLMMLGTTPSGDAYTFSEYERMFSNAGFSRCELHDLPPTIQRVVTAYC